MAYVHLLLLLCFLVFSGGIISMGVNPRLNETAMMEENELLGLFEVMGALVEDSDWAHFHPQPCTETPWPGIECEVNDDDDENPLSQIFHVTKIHIGPEIISPPCKSSAYLSLSLLKLPYLKSLSIFNCFVASQSPITLPTTLFGPFSSLEHLTLQSNPSLTGILPPSLGHVPKLRVLSLSQNNLQGQIPSQIGGLGFLEQLDLSFNNLSGQIPNEIGGMKKLTILDLSWNEIEGYVPYSIGQLQVVQKIDLSSNRLSGKVPSELGKLKRLILLDLSHNFLIGPVPETLSSLEDLEYLVIDDNPIKTGVPLFIGNLGRLKSVSFSGCGLTGPIPYSFSSLKNLASLSLDNNNLTGPVPSNLGSLPKLDQLNLSHNKLSGVLELNNGFIKKLGERLNVRGNNELCTSHNEQNLKNLSSSSSSYLEIPACLDSKSTRNGKSMGDDEESEGIKPTLYNSNLSSSSSSSGLDLQIILLLSLVSNFVLCFIFFVILL